MEIAAPPAAASRPRAFTDFSFLLKLVLALLLATLADWLFYGQRIGATLGFYAAMLLGGALLAHLPVRRGRGAWAAAVAALLFALVLADDPSLLAATLFWGALTLALLLPRTAAFGTASRWALRLGWQALRSFAGPLLDRSRIARARSRRTGALGLGRHLPSLVLPALGSALFLTLFAAANPLIAEGFARLSLGTLLGGLSLLRLAFWTLVLLPVWALLRPRLLGLPGATPAKAAPAGFDLFWLSPGSVALSLLAFNLVFALQNGLDLAFLWSGAPLPEGMTLAEYAHRGAYPLIATALLSGLFVLVTLQPGSPLAGHASIRRLVYLWIGQNLLLVASTALRTLDYVEAYSLTRLRIAALVWMALVAIGLVLICWRIWKDRSGVWLINANAAAAVLALAGCAFVDLGAVAAQWNVRHAREAGGRGAAIDLCYLEQLGPSALLPLIELESRRLPPSTRARVAWTRATVLRDLETTQADWHGWTFRNHRRLLEAQRLATERQLPGAISRDWWCGGSTAPALTPAAQG